MAGRDDPETHPSRTLAGRLLARPGAPTDPAPAGPQQPRLDLDGDHKCLLSVPPTYDPARPAPLALLLHGAGGNARQGLSLPRDLAGARGLILLAVTAARGTWDLLRGGYGPDVAVIDAALALVFDRYAVDAGHLAIGGFSDGASYALSLGLTNGDLFSHVIAFSPGFAAPADQQGVPAIYISHGTRDSVLPIDRCGRRLAPMLERAGYPVRYHEFDGGHAVPAPIAAEALAWFLD